jgi:hypothetical protein
MASKTPVPSTHQPASPSSARLGPRSNLPLHLLRHGSGLVGFGLLFGFLVPYTPYPRLGLTAHIQFAVEGTMVLAAGLLLQSDPFGNTKSTAASVPLAQRLGYWQRRVVYWGMAGIWVTLLSEAANAWWGTRWVLKLAHQAAGLSGGEGPAERWMEVVVSVAHKPFAMMLATVVSDSYWLKIQTQCWTAELY